MAKPWHAVFRNFDDDALATLASAGLLRRAAKDVEAGKVEWDAPPGDGGGSVRADGQIVRLAGGGPQHAQCDCPAPGICKHILAAALWLRELHSGNVSLEESADEKRDAKPADAAAGVIEEILALDLAAVFKSAGRAAVRRASEILAQYATVVVTDHGNSLLIAFAGAGACRYVGGVGFSGMVSDMPPSMRPAWHLAALLAVWREQGRPISWPGAIEIVAKEESGDPLSESERRFLQQVRELLHELCESGLSHVTEALYGQTRALNMSARSEKLPRLAGMLRTLAGTISLLARRDYHADERQAISLAARIYAVCAAFENAGGDALSLLRGRARRDFADGGALDLLPLGASWWENRSGARGLTILFWEPDTRRIVQAVLARPDASDTAFDKAGAWSRYSVWQGAGTAEGICKGSLQLTSVRLSDDGRLAVGGDTRAVLGVPWMTEDPRWMQAGYDAWTDVAEALRAGAGLTGDPLDCVLLKPKSIRPPRLDEVRQIFEWPLLDRHGNLMMLQLPCEEQYRRRIENIERLAADHLAIQAVVVRIDQSIRSGALEPVAVIRTQEDRLESVSLDFGQVQEKKQPLALAGRIMRMLKAGRTDTAVPATSLAARLLSPVVSAVERKLMTGRMALDEVECESLTQGADLARSVGLDTVAHAIDAYLAAPGPGPALQLHYLCMLHMDLDASFGLSSPSLTS